MDRRKPELLCPAGDMEKLRMAVAYGADAVYLAGTSFGMRSFTANFTPDELPQAIRLAHNAGVKVHCTVNIMPRNDEAAALPAYLEQLDAAGVDALILADLGAFRMAGKYAPHCQRHVSTQQSVANYACAQSWFDLGASRVVLARELSLQEIIDIRERVSPELELETFCHGAMCVSYSGRCLLSNYMTGRDSNRGQCAQPCRYQYALMEEKRPGEYYPIAEDETGSYILNAKDMCMIEHLDKLARAGVTSFKIEGRAKTEYYTAVVTNAYRSAVDAYLAAPSNDFKPAQWMVDEVYKISHRDYCTGFFFGSPRDDAQSQYYETSGYVRNYDVVAVVDRCQDGYIYCTQRNRFFKGDKLEILSPDREPIEYIADEIINEAGESVEVANIATMKLSMPLNIELPAGTIIRKEL